MTIIYGSHYWDCFRDPALNLVQNHKKSHKNEDDVDHAFYVGL